MKSKKLLYAISLMSLSFGANAADKTSAKKTNTDADAHYSEISATETKLAGIKCKSEYEQVDPKFKIETQEETGFAIG